MVVLAEVVADVVVLTRDSSNVSNASNMSNASNASNASVLKVSYAKSIVVVFAITTV